MVPGLVAMHEKAGLARTNAQARPAGRGDLADNFNARLGHYPSFGNTISPRSTLNIPRLCPRQIHRPDPLEPPPRWNFC
jgi:hypothetical protein